MKKNSALTIICTTLFLIGIIALLIGNRNPGSDVPGWALLTVALAYLLSGWYIFKGYFPEGNPVFLFIFGFLYASIFMAFSFLIAAWPMAKTFLWLSPVWGTAILAITFLLRKKLSKEAMIQFLTEGGILLLLSIVLLIKS